LVFDAKANSWDNQFVTQRGLILMDLNVKGCLRGTQSQTVDFGTI